ncbi:HD domain-containing phosphohydrolase [Terasakiella sp. SH-1]|uniref:HD-GYP domain-containing protein n=1 Tax=Terasakiella sp. SH-1 TaxID=2560057 RepID=UPI0010734670|nr:HD domain-containing phosphohydrolase [Terasakiella sp. SH-1]
MLKLNKNKAICALADALDYVGVDDLYHGHRVGAMAMQLVKKLGWSDLECLGAAHLGMLHDCGVSSSQEHGNLTMEMEWSRAKEHCARGAEYLGQSSLLEQFAVPVLYHHDRWEELQDVDISDRDKRLANLIFMADRIDVLAAQERRRDPLHNPLILLKSGIFNQIKKFSGTLFDPELVELFLDVGQTDAFWFSCSPEVMQNLLDDFDHVDDEMEVSGDEVRSFARLVGRIIDAKSAFTQDHSVKVARLSRRMGSICGLSEADLADLEIAGLLHDAGKLRVPDEILDKPGPLNAQERAVIRRHSFDSAMVLHNLIPNSRITNWVAMHHERWDGSGYPYSLKKDQLDREAQILALCDEFQALVQCRPYRDSLPPAKVMEIMNQDTAKGAFDPELMDILRTHLDEFYEIAR